MANGLGFLEASIVGGICILLFALLTHFLGGKFKKKYKMIVWFLIIVRLIIPIDFSIGKPTTTVEMPVYVFREVPVASLADDTEPSVVTDDIDSAIMADDLNTVQPENTVSNKDAQMAQGTKEKKAFTTNDIAFGVWMAGLILFMCYYISVHILSHKKIVRNSEYCSDEQILSLTKEIAGELKIKRVPEVCIMHNSEKSPFIVGFFKSTIYLPDSQYSEKNLHYILKHELVHCKNRDVLIKGLVLIVNAIHWFNPCVWLMRILISRDMEFICDEEVLGNATKEEQREYSEIIMSCISADIIGTSVLSTGYSQGTRFIKQRFKNIFTANKKQGGLFFIAGVLIILIVVSGVLHIKENVLQTNSINGQVFGLLTHEIDSLNQDTEDNFSEPYFSNLISDMDEQYIYYYMGKEIWKIDKDSCEKHNIYVGNNEILGIAVYEGWLYFLEDIRHPGSLPCSLSKIDTSGKNYVTIEQTDATLLDISKNILITRSYTIDNITDNLYELIADVDSIVEKPIESNKTVMTNDKESFSIDDTNDNKQVILKQGNTETILYEVEDDYYEVFVTNYNKYYVVLDLYNNENMQHQALVITLSDKKVDILSESGIHYADILGDWIIYIDDTYNSIHIHNMLDNTLEEPTEQRIPLQIFEQTDVAVIPEVAEYEFAEAYEIGEVQEIDGMLPGTGEGVWYTITIDGIEYYYGKYDFEEDAEPSFYGHSIISDAYSLANGISVGLTKEEVLAQYPNMAIKDFEGNYLEVETSPIADWNRIAYPRGYIIRDSDGARAEESFIWEEQFDYVMIADINLGTYDTLPIHIGLMMKDDIVAAITFYYPTAG